MKTEIVCCLATYVHEIHGFSKPVVSIVTKIVLVLQIYWLAIAIYGTAVFVCIVIIKCITVGAIAVSKLLVGNDTLQMLNISSNDIGNDGISVIAEQLQHNTTLTTLRIIRCGLSQKGIAS